ncbi:MAG: phosphoglucomutase [Acidithiobacillales bacterium SG8_45]|jgi:phosphomannomutase/phosphoglucomutase|nr:MAG: phosphoglucomutase [Acidithiobacillales bacterium SG8_45]
MSSSTLAPEIFKAYDIRGIVGKTLTNDTARAIGQALGSEALARKQQAIAVGRDGRLSGPDLVNALAEGIASTGCNVVNVGMVPTPVLYFATYHLETHSGVMVTGSHNPPDYNGFKMVLGGETLSGDDIQALRQRIESGDLASGNGSITDADVKEAYLGRITSDIKLARPMKIIVDCGNGVAGEMAPELYRRMDCDVTEMFCEIDGTFPNHHPDPSQPKNLEDLIATVKSTDGVDVGLAFDGDGDRVGVVTPTGDVIWPDRQLILLARSVLKRNPGGEIIFDVKCSRAVDRAIREAGGKPTMWKTGHSFIKKKLKETGALLAGEMSGHIFFKERWYGFDDALYAASRLLELLSQDARSPQEIFDSLPNTVNTPELQIRFNEGEHFAAIEKLVKQADFPGARLTTIDGLRADFEDGFGLVRASNTTPVLVLRFEGDDEAALQRIQEKFRELIERVVPEAELPF